MNLYQLRYFALLTQTGHFRKTAEQLCIAQPSLSHAISLLEKELGVTAMYKRQHPLHGLPFRFPESEAPEDWSRLPQSLHPDFSRESVPVLPVYWFRFLHPGLYSY